MPRKKIEPIVSLGSDEDKLLVQKSRPLFALWQSELTLAEFKILDTYLARINSHKPNDRVVKFEKGELEDILGLKQIKSEVLDERLKHLMTTIKIEDSTTKRGFTRIALFEKAMAEQDENGLWQVEMMCTQSAMKYVFNVESLGYLRYKLRCITSITSRYTYILFVYLESNRTMHLTWKVRLEELKKILNCDNEEFYKDYKYFNRDVMKRVQKEMHEKTECRFSYKPIRKGRSIEEIEFTVESLARLEETDTNQITLDEYLNESRELWVSALDEFKFSEEQLDEIRSVIVTIPNYKLPEDTVTGTNDINFQRYHYIDQQIKILKRRNSEKPIKNQFAYFIKMLRAEAKAE